MSASKQGALKHEYASDVEALSRALRADPQFPELGFSFSAWSGTEPAASVRATFGSFGDHVNNSFRVDLPELTAETEDLYKAATLDRLMTAVADALRPDWMAIQSTAADRLDMKEMQIAPGWKTFIRRARSSLASAPDLNETTLEFRGEDAWLTVHSDLWSVPSDIPARLREALVGALEGPYPWLRVAGRRWPSER